jgi:hypothetical protein
MVGAKGSNFILDDKHLDLIHFPIPLLHLRGVGTTVGCVLASSSTESLNLDGDGAARWRRRFMSGMDVEQGGDAVWKRRGASAVKGKGNKGRGGEATTGRRF